MGEGVMSGSFSKTLCFRWSLRALNLLAITRAGGGVAERWDRGLRGLILIRRTALIFKS